MCKVSLEYMGPNAGGNDLKIASFLVFLKMFLFEIQSAFFERQGIMGKVYILLLIIIFAL